jgi:hypothetical protein
MPATPARIGFITQQWRKSISTTTAVQTRYGALARETADPVETYFDSAANAQTIADARQALLSPERRRFRAEVAGVSDVLALNLVGAAPLARYVDTERNADLPALVSEVLIDLEQETATLTLWG